MPDAKILDLKQFKKDSLKYKPNTLARMYGCSRVLVYKYLKRVGWRKKI